MKYKCSNCNELNDIPEGNLCSHHTCSNCHRPLHNAQEITGDTSAAVGLIGGAALGASIGGPVGAIIGGIIGGLLGKDSKGVG
jgi:DNA-directed RNA polymerase subunit RPC12/RpoP